MSKRNKSTSVAEVFRIELLTTKLLGGHLFEGNKFLAYTYMFLVLLATKVLILLFASARFEEIDSFSKGARKNIEIYIILCYVFWLLLQVVILRTTIKHSGLLFVISRKQIDWRYFNSWDHLRNKFESRMLRVRGIIFLFSLFTALTARLRNSSRIELKSLGELEYRKFYNRSEESGPKERELAGTIRWLCFGGRQVAVNAAIIAQDILQAALVDSQGYGHQLVVLMVVATLNDMLLFACHRDQIPLDSWRRLEGRQRPAWKRAGAPLLTIKLLAQIRQVLLLVNSAISLEYLIAYLFSVSRMIYCVSMIYGQLKLDANSPSFLFTFAGEYFRNVSVMLFLRLAYFWLHMSVKKLKSAMEDIRIVEEARMSELERSMIVRLSEEILGITPTDWIKSNTGVIFTHQVYILTLVVTSEQIVEASYLQTGAS